MDDIRWDLIAHIQEQIEAGTYDTEGRARMTARIISDRLRSEENVENSGDVAPLDWSKS